MRTVRVLYKLLPSVLALRKDRRQWVKQEGRNVQVERYRKNARRALEAFISLGPVYIKLGQWLSSRADILPQPYMEELSKLQDSVPPAPFEEVRPVIEGDLGPLDRAFDGMEKEAFSGASLGQVYKATLGGQSVVVKVKRPGIERVVEEDLRVLKKILPLAMRFVDPNLQLSARAMLAQFTETIREEMDYTRESANLKKIKENMQRHPGVVIPDVYDDRTTRNVLTMQYLPGTKVTDIEALDRMGIDRRQLVIDVHKIFFSMLLHDAIFHADPHPGNISVTKDGKLILYDYGMVGRLDNETRLQLVRLYLALVEKDPSRTVDAMSALGMITPDFNRTVIEKAIELTVRAMHGRKPEEMEIQGLMEIANKTMSRFPFMLPKHLALYMRMASIIEGIYKTHKVDFKFVKVLKEILAEEDLIKEAYVEEIKHSLGKFAKSAEAAILLAPEIRRFIDDSRSMSMRRGGGTGHILPGSILSAAVFLGSAIMYTSDAALGTAGMAGALLIMAAFAVLGRRR
ncbi:unusual protein kinase [Cenarchaeum symbiosum A]|uniref:Unusual protein kinase n=1 Tax=Cenarchaeum symbiosum (strain A) TaxID=414004 RepID=A0RXR4_CENSY|nr:unusual protein kinase [Cenarchaeum symbiosum A]